MRISNLILQEKPIHKNDDLFYSVLKDGLKKHGLSINYLPKILKRMGVEKSSYNIIYNYGNSNHFSFWVDNKNLLTLSKNITHEFLIIFICLFIKNGSCTRKTFF